MGPMLSPGASPATRVDVVLQQLVELPPLVSPQFLLLAYAWGRGRGRSGHGGLGARPTVCFLHHQLVMCEAVVVQAAVVLVAWYALVLHHGPHGEQVVLCGRSCHQHAKLKVGCSCVGLVVLCGSLVPFFCLLSSPHPCLEAWHQRPWQLGSPSRLVIGAAPRLRALIGRWGSLQRSWDRRSVALNRTAPATA